MHEVETTLLALDRCDRLDLELRRDSAASGITLELAGDALSADISADGENLALRGAQLAVSLARERGLVAEASLHLRLTMGWRGRKLAWVLVFAIIGVLISFWGVNLVMEGSEHVFNVG